MFEPRSPAVQTPLGRSVFRDKYSRPRPGGGHQTYGARIAEVIEGNLSLTPRVAAKERACLLELGERGVLPFSGRHLQHGDTDQRHKSIEVFANCASAPLGYLGFWLLLKGCGVGRSYSDAHCPVDYRALPKVVCALSERHPDYTPELNDPARLAEQLRCDRLPTSWVRVLDSADGWSQAVRMLEERAFAGTRRDERVVFDLSDVRPRGTPIAGQQGRGSSGPLALLRALEAIGALRDSNAAPWLQAMHCDHALAECVMQGGARRSARLAAKWWRDPDALEFIALKRNGGHHSANHSLLVDRVFWSEANVPGTRAHELFEAATAAIYHDGSGEPGFINVDRLTWRPLDAAPTAAACFGPTARAALGMNPASDAMFDQIARRLPGSCCPCITNPCGEVVLGVHGGYCIIGDVCLANAESEQEAHLAAAALARFLVRVNLMDGLYAWEKRRTNRIGVSLTGIHEFAYLRWGYTFDDLCSERRGAELWRFLRQLRRTAEQAAAAHARELGLSEPHTVTAIKPSGTISKLLDCTEGAHLPSDAQHLRWVQLPLGDPALEQYAARGYPVRDVSRSYPGRAIVGFPTRPRLAKLMRSGFVAAASASVAQHYRWLELLQASWLGHGHNNQISYTLTFDPARLSFADFQRHVLAWQPRIRACSFLPQTTPHSYEYLPIEPLSPEQYSQLESRIQRAEHESYDETTLSCSRGSCEVDA